MKGSTGWGSRSGRVFRESRGGLGLVWGLMPV